jgi:replicative DNA helicase
MEAAIPVAPLVPHSRDAEEAVVGSILINPEAYYEVDEFLRAGDFYIHRLRWCMEAFKSLHERRVPIDILTLADELEARKLLSEAGGPAYLTSLLNQVPTSLNAVGYAQIVKGHSARRKMIEAANQIAKAAYDTGQDAAAAFVEAERAWQNTRAEADRPTLINARQMMSMAFDRYNSIVSMGRPPGIITGLLDLDRVLHGCKKGRYYMVAGRPGDGKSALLLTLARNFCKHEGKSVLYFSIEMQESTDDGDMISGGELSERLIGMEAGVDTTAISDGRLKEAEAPLFTHAIEKIADWRFTVDDDPGVTPDQMMARALRVKGEIGLDVIMVDYLQITESGARFGTRAEEVSYLSKRLKRMAKELNVVMIVAAQVNRGFAVRGDKRLILSDLKESGSLEQDSHVVMFIQPTDNLTMKEIEVAKHRGGKVGKCELYYDAPCTEFRNGTRRDDGVQYWWQKNGNGHNGNGKH